MIEVKRVDQMAPDTYCNGCWDEPLPGTLQIKAEFHESWSSRPKETRTMRLCKDCRIELIHELVKTI